MNNNELTKHYIAALKDIIKVDVVYGSKSEMLLRGSVIAPGFLSELDILNKINHLPGKASVETMDPGAVIRVQMPGAVKIGKLPWLNIILFLLTLITTLLVGAAGAGVDFIENPQLFWQAPFQIIAEGVPFSFSLMAILLFHEFGHYTASRFHGVSVTLPYFIPFPNIIGTAGALIRIKSPFLSRKQLFDVGAAGPLSGMFIAIPLTIWGLSNPTFLPESTDLSGLFILGDPLLFSFISWLVQQSPPEGFITLINPMAFAAWVGFLVTMINLLPIGQLDGGHIIYAMFGRAQHKIGYVMLLILLILSFWWIGWLIWAFFVYIIIKPKHPPTVLDEIPLDNKRMAIGYLCIAIFILCFIPVPFSGF